MVERARLRARIPAGRVPRRRPRDRGGRSCDDRRTARRVLPDSPPRPDRDRGEFVNPANLEVLQTALSLIPEDTCVSLRRTAYSPTINDTMKSRIAWS